MGVLACSPLVFNAGLNAGKPILQSTASTRLRVNMGSPDGYVSRAKKPTDDLMLNAKKAPAEVHAL